MGVWIKLKTKRMLEIAGTPTHFQKGDWVEVGKQTALAWIAAGIASTPRPLSEFIPPGCGSAVPAAYSGHHSGILSDLELDITETTIPNLPYRRTMFVRGPMQLRPTTLAVGFGWLTAWQVVAPLFDYETTAAKLGTARDKAWAAETLPDLRVPIYDTRLVFVRRDDGAAAFLDEWATAVAEGYHDQMAFLVALYKHKPLICAAPAQWMDASFGP